MHLRRQVPSLRVEISPPVASVKQQKVDLLSCPENFAGAVLVENNDLPDCRFLTGCARTVFGGLLQHRPRSRRLSERSSRTGAWSNASGFGLREQIGRYGTGRPIAAQHLSGVEQQPVGVDLRESTQDFLYQVEARFIPPRQEVRYTGWLSLQ